MKPVVCIPWQSEVLSTCQDCGIKSVDVCTIRNNSEAQLRSTKVQNQIQNMREHGGQAGQATTQLAIFVCCS